MEALKNCLALDLVMCGLMGGNRTFASGRMLVREEGGLCAWNFIEFFSGGVARAALK